MFPGRRSAPSSVARAESVGPTKSVYVCVCVSLSLYIYIYIHTYLYNNNIIIQVLLLLLLLLSARLSLELTPLGITAEEVRKSKVRMQAPATFIHVRVSLLSFRRPSLQTHTHTIQMPWVSMSSEILKSRLLK